jgi:hypothetical protein
MSSCSCPALCAACLAPVRVVAVWQEATVLFREREEKEKRKGERRGSLNKK